MVLEVIGFMIENCEVHMHIIGSFGHHRNARHHY